MAFGEAYMRGDIEVRGSLGSLMEAVYLTNPWSHAPWHRRLFSWLGNRISKSVSPNRAVANARHHYNLGTDFFQLWLDPTLTYSCAYFLSDADALGTAQHQKLELLCRKAKLKRGQTLLDIGCGWGSLLIHAARFYGVQATGVTPADNQADYVRAIVRREGLDDRVRVVKADWRNLEGQFDRVISVGMFEHVGEKQYAEFFRRWRELLAPGGLSILHTIGRMLPDVPDQWIEKYIFPGGYLPTLGQIAEHAAKASMFVIDVENLRRHYARTLDHWIANFQRSQEKIIKLRGEEFARMWSLYLHGSRAGFRCGDLELWQTVLAKDQRHSWPLNRDANLVGAPVSGPLATAGNLA